jgi:hypothetical protein
VGGIADQHNGVVGVGGDGGRVQVKEGPDIGVLGEGGQVAD